MKIEVLRQRNPWLINYIPEIKHKKVSCVKDKFMIFLEQMQPRIIVNQHLANVLREIQISQKNNQRRK